MPDYLIIQTRDPFEAADVVDDYRLAGELAAAGNGVCLFLAQNGVLPAREGALASALATVADRGVEVLADRFSLSERGIADDMLGAGVNPASLETAVDRIADGCKTIWL